MAPQTASLLGLIDGGPAGPVSAFDLARQVEMGLRVPVMDRLIALLAPDEPTFGRHIVSKATLSRRRASPQPTLSVEESNTVARLAKVWDMAMRVWADEEIAREFLRRPHPLLDGRRPREVAVASDPGADAVINLMGRGLWGGGA